MRHFKVNMVQILPEKGSKLYGNNFQNYNTIGK